MGDFAINVAMSYQIGAARDNRSILSAMDIRRDEFFADFGQTINDLILGHREMLETRRQVEGNLIMRLSTPGPKTRWVDGTPEYSLHICGLRKLFSGALFIHLVRDVDSVVRSMLNFYRVSGTRLVANEEEAYKYWFRTVTACLKAEQAYGPKIIHRLRYSTLVENRESAIRSLLDFVGEPYNANCLEPLAKRINSSNVPADFKSDDPATDPAIVEQARRLSAQIEETAQPSKASPAAADEMEASFEESCLRTKTLEEHYIAEIEGYKSQIAGYAERLSKQLQNREKLACMLDEVAKISASLRSSWFWRFANWVSAIEAKLFHHETPVPDEKFEKILARYSHWRASHPGIAKLDRPTEPTGLTVPPSDSVAQCDNVLQARSIHKV